MVTWQNVAHFKQPPDRKKLKPLKPVNPDGKSQPDWPIWTLLAPLHVADSGSLSHLPRVGHDPRNRPQQVGDAKQKNSRVTH